ncbi:MAG: 3-hydroxyacyl-CoA dehydrogenase/enoyl-CoA hydratase family protein, partial [Acidobacteria bacterium]|nr:3-hydroxyacyl-CoA dehydrogenase/enoyl-CoA hydratase family protein [Acidobacteriota bacterium]
PNRRSVLAEEALRQLPKMDPPPIVTDDVLERIRPGNIEDDWDRLWAADWVLEAVVERLDVKRVLLERLDTPRLQARWVTTNTSGLSVHAMVEGRSAHFQARFFGTHFFNPPRYLPLVEVVPQTGVETDRVEELARWLRQRLGKRIVRAKDTPNFIANRLGVFQVLATLRLMESYGLSIEEVDTLTGPLLGRPRTATFRTLDLVGLDVWATVVRTLQERAVRDEFYEWFQVPAWIQALIEAGALGRKTRKGIYWRRDSERLVWDPRLGDYRSEKTPAWPWLERVQEEPELRDRLALLRRLASPLAEFVERLVAYGCIYAARRVPEIADSIVDIDGAVRWGFQHSRGPFQTWDDLGDDCILRHVSELPAAPVPVLELRQKIDGPRFYMIRDRDVFCLDLAGGRYQKIGPEDYEPVAPWVRRTTPCVLSNAGASLHDVGDGVFALLWHPARNAIGGDVLEMVQRSLEYVERNGLGLVILSAGEHFSYGANLALLLMALQNRDAAQVDWMVRTFQSMTRSIRQAPFPVVVCTHGMTLGGGCEFMLYADRVVAAAESYIGLVELGAGLIPAGGGCCEVIRRAQAGLDLQDRTFPWVHYLDRLRGFFQLIAQAQVSRSAQEARQWGYLRGVDVIVWDADARLAVAKQVVRDLAPTYVPSEETPLWVLGADGLAYLQMAVHLFHRGGYITDYERYLGERLAYVLAGGDLPHPTQVSVDYILDLERQTFLSLCKQPKTYERAAHILAYGRPIRN